MSRSVLLAAVAVTAPALADEPSPRAENMLPLAVGNSWTYKVSSLDDPRFPRVQDDRFVVRVVRQEMVGEQTCFRLDASLKDRIVATEHLAFTKDGLFRFRVDKEDVTPPLPILRWPVRAKNDPWKEEYRLGGRTATARFSVQNPAGSVTVPAGKFKTVSIHAEMGDSGLPKTTVWYSEGVGVVRQRIEEGKRPPLLLELEKFDKEAGK